MNTIIIVVFVIVVVIVIIIIIIIIILLFCVKTKHVNGATEAISASPSYPRRLATDPPIPSYPILWMLPAYQPRARGLNRVGYNFLVPPFVRCFIHPINIH